jgi:V-type H+-transporting ATPase subunit E
VPYLISGEGDSTVIYTFTKMNDAAVAKQLENMVSFIKKEAEEKAEEILAKAEEDFTIEKAKKVQAQKLKLMKEFERKMKEVEVQKKM